MQQRAGVSRPLSASGLRVRRDIVASWLLTLTKTLLSLLIVLAEARVGCNVDWNVRCNVLVCVAFRAGNGSSQAKSATYLARLGRFLPLRRGHKP